MNVFICAIVACLGVTLCQGATTHHPHMGSHHPHTGTHMPHTTGEPVEHEKFQFFYEPSTQKMVLHNNHLCYVVTMTPDEISSVHTDAGIRAVELRILSQLSGATEVTKDRLDHFQDNKCGNKIQHYYTIE